VDNLSGASAEDAQDALEEANPLLLPFSVMTGDFMSCLPGIASLPGAEILTVLLPVKCKPFLFAFGLTALSFLFIARKLGGL
jgi:hypothetical protein